ETTRRRLAAFSERSRSLSSHPANPLAKLDRVIDLNVLICEELILLMQHTADSQATLGRELRPLPKASPRGSGR
ncbi:MAG TPA: hypothetical protein V6D05_17560, partial [Stenomitos sp.]